MASTKIDPDRIKLLKQRVKLECLRRSQTPGSVEKYGGAEYDYSVSPNTKLKADSEHRDKIIVPLNAINNKIKNENSEKTKINDSDITYLESFVTLLENANMTSTSHNCSSNCTGLCSIECNTGCTSCTSCSGKCTGCTGCTSCSGECSNCTGQCGTGCEWVCQECSVTCSGSGPSIEV